MKFLFIEFTVLLAKSHFFLNGKIAMLSWGPMAHFMTGQATPTAPWPTGLAMRLCNLACQKTRCGTKAL